MNSFSPSLVPSLYQSINSPTDHAEDGKYSKKLEKQCAEHAKRVVYATVGEIRRWRPKAIGQTPQAESEMLEL